MTTDEAPSGKCKTIGGIVGRRLVRRSSKSEGGCRTPDAADFLSDLRVLERSGRFIVFVPKKDRKTPNREGFILDPGGSRDDG